jgi:hypothetical protein
VTRDGDHKISLLSVDGNKVEDSKKFTVGGIRRSRFSEPVKVKRAFAYWFFNDAAESSTHPVKL